MSVASGHAADALLAVGGAPAADPLRQVVALVGCSVEAWLSHTHTARTHARLFDFFMDLSSKTPAFESFLRVCLFWSSPPTLLAKVELSRDVFLTFSWMSQLKHLWPG